MIRYRITQLLLAVSLALGSLAVQAQQLQAELSHYSTDDGLASNAISYMTQDDYGYVWIATWNGLSRFDGHNFYNYATGAVSRIPHLHNRIRSLAVDNQQNVWMHMYDNRVFVLKRSKDKIINPFEGIAGSDEFRTLYPITVTSSGLVLINIEGVGLYKLKSEGDGFSAEKIVTGGYTVTSMAEGYQNDIWLGTDKGVHRMDISNLTVERKGLFLDEHITCLFSNGYNIFAGSESGTIMSFSYGQEPVTVRRGEGPVSSLFIDSYGLVWFSDNNHGAIRLNMETGSEKRFTQPVLTPDFDSQGASFRETDGLVWVRMNRGGYGYYNRETDEVEFFHNDPTNTWNLSNSVNASLELNEGVVWESTNRRGLEKLDIRRRIIERKKLYAVPDGSMANEIRALYYDQERKWLMVGNKAGELLVIKSDSSRTVYKHGAGGKPFGRIYGLTKDSKGNYWLCSKDNGVFMLSLKGDGVGGTCYVHEEGNPWSLSSNGAYMALEDKAGNIWVATYGGGVNLLTRNKQGQMVALNSSNAMKDYPKHSHHKVRTIALDKDGNVWAGTTDGVLIMSYKDRKVNIQKLEPSEEDPDHILMSNDVVCLMLDRMGSMWVGTNGGGLAHTIGKDSKGVWLFEHFGARDGLPGDEIRSLTTDNRDMVWFSTDHVLCSYDTDKRIFSTFSNMEGVDETMCSESAALTLPNSDILFGTYDGYYMVERAKLVNTTGNILKLRITDFWLNDELQSPRFNDVYSYYVPDSREVKLPNHDARLSFRFVSLNYQLQHRVHYQYMLEGYDDSWQNADKNRIVSYEDLPTGSYRFLVKAFLLESPERYDMRQIEVVVPPYFLLTSNAIWLYMAIVAALAICLMLYRQRQLAKEENMRVLREGKRSFNYEQEEDVVFMQRQNEFMEVHVSDPMLAPEELVEMSGLTKEEYARQLYQITQFSPREYINEYRLTKALQMLTGSDATIAEIVFKCGYPDASAFNRQVKAKIGMLPSKYRDLCRKESAQTQDVEQADEEEQAGETS